MVTITFCLRRRPGISAAEFSAYWRDRHAPLFRDYATALGVLRYTQTHQLVDPINDALMASRGGPAGYDGVAQVWFDSMDSLLAGLRSGPGRAAGLALIEDERSFIDHSNSPIWVGEQHEVALPPK
jgi:uncharacterized protein (TIGR02118 family)